MDDRATGLRRARQGAGTGVAPSWHLALLCLLVCAAAKCLPARADGLADPSFGQAGQVKVAFPNSSDGPLQTGTIVNGHLDVAGFAPLPNSSVSELNSPPALYLAQISTAGVPSNAQIIHQQALQNPIAIVIRADGDIFAAGVNFDPNGLAHATVVWFDPSGQVIASYMRTATAANDQSACVGSTNQALMLDTRGAVVVTCLYGTLFGDETEDTYTVQLVRLIALNGALSPDASFGTGGWQAVPAPPGCGAESERGFVFADTGSGFYYYGGYCAAPVMPDVSYVSRLNAASGLLDPTYGTNGFATVPIAGPAWLFKLDGNQRTVIAGAREDDVTSCCQIASVGAFVARANADGSIDSTFGNEGTVPADWAGRLDAILVDGIGRIYLLGSQLSRLTENGARDTTFSSSSDAQAINGAGSVWGTMIYADAVPSSIYLVGGAFAAKSATTGIVEKVTLSGGPAVASSAVSLTAEENSTALTLTAIVTGNNPTGSVTFSDGTAVLGSSPLTNGATAFSTAVTTAGTYSIVAYYGGDAANGFSNSQSVLISVAVTNGATGGSGSSSGTGSVSGATTSVGAISTSGGGGISELDLAVLALATVLAWGSKGGRAVNSDGRVCSELLRLGSDVDRLAK